MPGDDLTHGPPATKKQAAVTTGRAGSAGIPCAMVYALYRALPGDLCLVATVVRETREHLRDLSACFGAPEPHDFTVRIRHVRLTCHPRPPHPRPTFVTIGRNVPLQRGGMREKVVLICPTWQALTPATDWHDGQFAHGAHAEIARRATACAAASRGRHSRERMHRQRDRGRPFSLQTNTHSQRG